MCSNLSITFSHACSEVSTSIFPMPEDPLPHLCGRYGWTLLQSTPLLLALFTGCVIVLWPTVRALTFVERTLLQVVLYALTAMVAALVWRVVELLHCDDKLDNKWGVPGIITVVLVSVGLVHFVMPFRPRIVGVTFWLVALGSLVADWIFRGGYKTSLSSPGAYPLIAIQQILCTQTLLAIAFIAPTRSRCVTSAPSAPLSSTPSFTATPVPSSHVELMKRTNDETRAFWLWQMR